MEQGISDPRSIEARLQRLEDIEAIRSLKIEYARLCDANYDPEGLAALFTEDGVWDGGDLGAPHGRKEIADYWRECGKIVSFALHYTMNHSVKVAPSGTEATGEALLIQPMTLHDKAAWCAVTYHEDYVKIDGQWLFKRMKANTHFLTAFELGWAKEKFVHIW